MPFDITASQYPRSTFLPRRGSLVLDGAEGTIISVDSGCLWVTLENDPRDVVLGGGMRFEVDRSGRTVVVAEEDSRLRLTSPGIPQGWSTPRPANRASVGARRRGLRQTAKDRRVPHY